MGILQRKAALEVHDRVRVLARGGGRFPWEDVPPRRALGENKRVTVLDAPPRGPGPLFAGPLEPAEVREQVRRARMLLAEEAAAGV